MAKISKYNHHKNIILVAKNKAQIKEKISKCNHKIIFFELNTLYVILIYAICKNLKNAYESHIKFYKHQ